jgi:hypothetical protein
MASAGSIFVQARPEGSRATVLATRDAAVATLSNLEASMTLLADKQCLSRAKRLAVAAVRAVPELRWASVEVVFPRPDATDSPPLPSVEHLSTDPFLPVGHRILDGSIEGFLETILAAGSRPRGRLLAGWLMLRRSWRRR